eukprot:CAMPEP_0167815872 /NCGR_PEP_ID=MMETSP0112_2-20121227/3268_1 /TAXON_ID=91324 /ORGANISM="Lotharella globosa, Strain CCCM811" /LENGTH=109 /DNA_ID=CAMNT_0007715349 /DNA_START=944 /DNA_END=1272 /DNA_ORIENTATION=+
MKDWALHWEYLEILDTYPWIEIWGRLVAWKRDFGGDTGKEELLVCCAYLGQNTTNRGSDCLKWKIVVDESEGIVFNRHGRDSRGVHAGWLNEKVSWEIMDGFLSNKEQI